jgi:hypothetical protein
MLERTGKLLFVAAIASLIIWYAYNNSLDNAFAFDDHLAITNNHDVKDASGHRIWTDDIWGKELSAHDSHKSFRPLLMLLFRKLWSISSEARWFREISILAHFAATILFHLLTLAIWNNETLAIGATALFAAHPIHVESVTAVVNMAEAFSSVLILASYLLFLQAIKPRSSSGFGFYGAKLLGLAIVWVAMVVVAALFKETGITACLLVICKTIMDSVLHMVAVARCDSNLTSKVLRTWRTCRPQIAAYTLFALTAVLTTHVYMAARTLITSTYRDDVLASPAQTMYHVLLKPIAERQRESYLDTSQLLRRAENPFAQLHGWEKMFSAMV